MRLLENGIAIYVADAPRDTIGVDTEEDLKRAEKQLLASSYVAASYQLSLPLAVKYEELRARIGVRAGSASANMMSMKSNAAQFAMPNPPIPILDSETSWKQVVARDPEAEFFYGVTTTGVYCRPSCASRRPLRENVRFFSTAKDAQAAGFRPCKKCAIATGTACSSLLDRDSWLIESHADRAVSLEELGRVAGLSPFTVQRLFKREMGVSPLQYQRALRAGKSAQ